MPGILESKEQDAPPPRPALHCEGSMAASSSVISGGDPFSVDPSVQTMSAARSWREPLTGFEWLALRAAPVYFGYGAPRGHGEPIVLLPGFMGSDMYLAELFFWLGRIGYQPYFSGLELNTDCPDATMGHLLAVLRRAKRETGQKPILIGHSLGGMIARAIALDSPDLLGGVISMGSPFKGVAEVHPVIPALTSALLRLQHHKPLQNLKPSCYSGFCMCVFNRSLLSVQEYAVPHFAIYSKHDGVVHWENCLEDDPLLNDEVDCSHTGMAWHPGVYRVLARRLAEIVAVTNTEGAAPIPVAVGK